MDNKDISKFIKQWRIIYGLKSEQVAERAGFSVQTYSKLENGELSLSLSKFLRIAKIFGFQKPLLDAIDPINSDLGRTRVDELIKKRIRK
jgi:transcriptional regulator with XRE-family HTH domain